ncbi:MAG: hypothetical protein MJ211_15235 [Bacteroidales bacterium]|nr:hypothetical protein [Bacteroidales bacterium]
MKYFYSLIFIIISNISYSQIFNTNNIIKEFEDHINNNLSQFLYSIKNDFKNTDSISQSLLLDYLSNYSKNSILYYNICGVKSCLELFYCSKFDNLRQRATNLLIDIYRITNSNSIDIPFNEKFKISDFDDKSINHIFNILQDSPLSLIEKDIIYKNNYKSIYNFYLKDTIFINKYSIKSNLSPNEILDSICTSMININLTNLSFNKDYLLGIVSWLNCKDAYLLLNNELKTDTTNVYLQVCLARLGNKKYQNEIIKRNLSLKFLNYSELAFMNTKEAIQTMIQGLRIEGQDYGIVGELNNNGEYVYSETKGDYYKSRNLQNLLIGDYLIPKIPFKIDMLTLFTEEIPESLCEDVAKWMEDNIDILQINPEFRY